MAAKKTVKKNNGRKIMAKKIKAFIYFTDGTVATSEYYLTEIRKLNYRLSQYGLFVKSLTSIKEVKNLLVKSDNGELVTVSEYLGSQKPRAERRQSKTNRSQQRE